MQRDLEASEVYNRECSIQDSWSLIDGFVRRLTVLELEAQDLIELQDLLETNVVNFDVLPQCHHDLDNLKHVWEMVRIIDAQQSEWRRHRWQKMNTKFLRQETNKQLDMVKSLPEDVLTWDVYMGLHESIATIQVPAKSKAVTNIVSIHELMKFVCLATGLPAADRRPEQPSDAHAPLEAAGARHGRSSADRQRDAQEDDAGRALRTRPSKYDKQLCKDRFSGSNCNFNFNLYLSTEHVDDVRAIVQRAVKDLTIEQSLKNYEAVWLSKVFALRPHVRNKNIAYQMKQDKENNTKDGADANVSATSTMYM